MTTVRKKRSKSAKKKSTEAELVPIKMHARAKKAIKANAKKYAQGNFSAWMRHAAMRYIPKRGEVIDLSTMPRAKSVKSKKH